MKKIDVDVLRNILKQLKAFNKDKISLSDVGFYLKVNSKDVKSQMSLIEKNFTVERVNNRIMVKL